MAYAPQVVATIYASPKTLGNRLGRWAVHLDFPVTKIARITGASRQTVYNWFAGGEVLRAYEPGINSLIRILETSSSAEEVWRKACKAYNLKD